MHILTTPIRAENLFTNIMLRFRYAGPKSKQVLIALTSKTCCTELLNFVLLITSIDVVCYYNYHGYVASRLYI